jgi:nicotinate-nucleotide pyrophosphorylase (carboxylating)
MQHLSGIATLTRKFVDALNGLPCRVYDTRKTTPGLRQLEKYAVRVGGGSNHRFGLFDAVLIKDNHLAAWRRADAQPLAEAVRQARSATAPQTMIAIEVDSVAQLAEVLPGQPDLVLLDNMGLNALREAVVLRNQVGPSVQLEASGGITLENARAIAETGVDRISVGALTHSAPALDLSLDFSESDA